MTLRKKAIIGLVSLSTLLSSCKEDPQQIQQQKAQNEARLAYNANPILITGKVISEIHEVPVVESYNNGHDSRLSNLSIPYSFLLSTPVGERIYFKPLSSGEAWNGQMDLNVNPGDTITIKLTYEQSMSNTTSFVIDNSQIINIKREFYNSNPQSTQPLEIKVEK